MIVVIFDGSEVRVMGTRSRFSSAGVFAFAFPAKPSSVRIADAFESVFAFALCSSLTRSEVVFQHASQQRRANNTEETAEEAMAQIRIKGTA